MVAAKALGACVLALGLVTSAMAAAQNPPSAGFPPVDEPPKAQPSPAAPPPAPPPAAPPPAAPPPAAPPPAAPPPAAPPPAAPPPAPPAPPAPPPTTSGPVGAFPTSPAPAPARAPAPAAPVYTGPPQPDQALGPYQRRPWTPKDEVVERETYVRVGPAGIRTHDGFYLRFAGGIGSGRDRATSGDSFTDIDTGDTTAYDAAGSGFAVATEIAIGFTPIRSIALVLGAAVYTATVPGLEMSGVAIGHGKYEYDASQLAIFSPHIDYYLNPETGLHFQGGFGFAAYIAGQALPSEEGDDARAHTATGLGFMLGIGYDWWIADQWSFGLLGRVLYAWTDGTDPESVGWSHKTFAPTLMLTATYH